MVAVTILTVLILASVLLFENAMENFAREKDAKKRERYSIMWHGYKWISMILIFVQYLAVYDAWVYLMWGQALTGLFAIGFDGYKGLKYGKGFWYAGDGKGSTWEIILSTVAKKIGMRFQTFYTLTKLTYTGAGIAVVIIWWDLVIESFIDMIL